MLLGMASKRPQDLKFYLISWNKIHKSLIVIPKVAKSSRDVRIPDEVTTRSTTKTLTYMVNSQKTSVNSRLNQDIIPKPDGSVTLPTPVKPIRQELIKKLPVEYHGVKDINFNDESMWYPVYKFPHIKFCVFLIRFKLYLSVLSGSAFFYHLVRSLTYANLDALSGAALLPIISFTGLCVVGNYFRKFVVQIYTSEDIQYVRLCRFTIFGSRLDIVLPLTSVIPLTENNVSKRSVLLKLKTKRPREVDLSYDNYEFYDEIFKITIKYGGILDRDRFQGALGYILDKKA